MTDQGLILTGGFVMHNTFTGSNVIVCLPLDDSSIYFQGDVAHISVISGLLEQLIDQRILLVRDGFWTDIRQSNNNPLTVPGSTIALDFRHQGWLEGRDHFISFFGIVAWDLRIGLAEKCDLNLSNEVVICGLAAERMVQETTRTLPLGLREQGKVILPLETNTIRQ